MEQTQKCSTGQECPIALGEFAEIVTLDTLSSFVDRVATETKTEDYRKGVIREAAQTLNMDIEGLTRLIDNRRLELFKDTSTARISSNYHSMLQQCIITGSDFLSLDIPDRPIIMSPWLREGSLTMITAPRGVGKTWFQLSILTAITHGLSIGSWTTANPVPCLLVDGEMSLKDLQDRMRALSQGLSDPICHINYLSSEHAHQKGHYTPNLTDQQFQDALYDYLSQSDIKVVVFDNLSSLTPGRDENSKQDYDPINQFFLRIRFLGISVIIIHHAGKDPKKTANRGSSAHEDSLDCSVSLSLPTRYKPSDGCRFNVDFTKARGIKGNGVDPFCFSLKDTDTGGLTWTTETKGSGNRDAAIALLAGGISSKEIAAVLKVDKSLPSKIAAKAVVDGFLKKVKRGQYEFTPKGKGMYGHIDIDELLIRC